MINKLTSNDINKLPLIAMSAANLEAMKEKSP
jgi:hypothetical protein